MQGIIHLENLRKSYFMGSQAIPVLKGISLDIFKNEYVALMGPSGSGKSTLMNILGCLDTPTGGQYVLNGKDVSKMTDDELADVRNVEIGFVFQQFNLLPRLTAVENVALPLVYAGISKKDRTERAMIALKKVGLAERSHHKSNEMSSHSTMADRQAQESTPANTLQNLHAEEFGLFLHQASESRDALTVLERGFFCTCLLCGPNPALHRNGPIANVALPPPARYVRRIRRGSLPPSGPADQTTASSTSSGAACKGPVP